MRRAKILWGLVVALALGSGASGCSRPAPDPSLGSFCAASADGTPSCVSATQGPAAAWNKVKNGPPPVQMWALRPEAVTLDQLLLDSAKLKAWFADVEEVLAYLHDTQGNAESYRASVEGKLGSLLVEARERQIELLKQSPVDAVSDFKQALSDKATAHPFQGHRPA